MQHLRRIPCEASAAGWYIAQLKPNGLKQARTNLDRQGFFSFMPQVDGTMRNGSGFRATRKSLFPGYLFVQLDPQAHGWKAINSTYGICRLVTLDGRKPARLPDDIVTALMERCDSDEMLLAARRINPGDRVRTLTGAFADFVGTVEALAAGDRIIVLLELMGRPVRTELSSTSVELAS